MHFRSAVALAFKYICSAKLKFQREAHARQRQLYLASVSAPQPLCKVRPFLLHDLDWCFQDMCEGSRNLKIQLQTKTLHSNTCQDFMCFSFKIAYQDSRQQTKQNCLSATWLCPKNHLTASRPGNATIFPANVFFAASWCPLARYFRGCHQTIHHTLGHRICPKNLVRISSTSETCSL